MPSFDIVSKLDMQEVDNAVNMVKRDIGNRYDFKGSSSSITLSKGDNNISIEADNEYQPLGPLVNFLWVSLLNQQISHFLPPRRHLQNYYRTKGSYQEKPPHKLCVS